MMKKLIAVSMTLAFVIAGYLAFTTVDEDTAVVVAGKKTYSGTLYIAGMGGHMSAADVTIDPNNEAEPIKMNSIDRIVVGDKTSFPIHDARIDCNDRNVTFWATYKLDPDGNLHAGKSDLKTGKIIKQVVIPKPERATDTPANYCASGQSKNSYIPISMANEGYLEIRDKKTLELQHRIFMTELGYKPGTYTFVHGVNSPDMTKMLVTLNDTPAGFKGWIGKTTLIMLDMAALEKGEIKKLAEGSITGTPGKTITFRQYFTPDGKYILQSGADRGYLIDAETLKAVDEITDINGDNHDIMPTPDGKYAVMTLREKVKDEAGKEIVDGTIQLYDIEARKVLGKSVSVCASCHDDVGLYVPATLCGVDGNWN